VASGGTRAGSEIDFATGYVRHMLGFIGVTDVEFVTADQLAIDPDASLQAAYERIERIAA
jgi:FMN-dependent NADH-azoreductase